MTDPFTYIRSNPRLRMLEPQLLPLIWPAIRATSRKTSSSPLGASRFGGLPDLQVNEPWPEGPCGPMTPVAMFRCSEIHAAAPWTPLPSRGLLYLWFDSRWDHWGHELNDARGFLARFIPDESATLTRRPAPLRPNLTTTQLEENKPNSPEAPLILGGHTVTFQSSYTFEQPHHGADPAIGTALEPLRNKFGFHRAGRRWNQLFGWPDCFQSPFDLIPPGPMRDATIEEEFAAIRESRPMNPLLRAKANEWLLLADIGWEDKTDWLDLGDAGQMLWSIHKDDLERQEFSKVWLTIQCG